MSKHGGNREEVAELMGISSESLIDFSANINPLGLSKQLVRELREKIPELIHYPDSEYRKLKQVLSIHHQLASNQILPGNGEAEIIYLLAQAMRPQHVLLLAPTFSEYEEAFSLVKSKFTYFDLLEEELFKLNDSRFRQVLKETPEIDCICLCQPNNPTGQLLTKEWLLTLLAYCDEKNISLILDEAFMDFIPNSENYTLIKAINKSKNLFILRSLTKFYALPGLRLGYIVTDNQDIIESMKEYQVPWSINTLADYAGQVVFNDPAYQKATLDLVEKEKVYLETELKKIAAVTVFPSSVNYILLKITEPKTVKEQLLKAGLLIRSCSNYRGLDGTYYRIAVKNHEQNSYLIQELLKVCMAND
ncbi:threonine-phosphate decarboxylase CobD [Vagococcus intermedius]|uniref:threonine-phosphate decarboxylase n=1 Tax=Vagococcus intermedius TaxID=2991418 RepID=A0AAF0CTK1_9ENTE|nr:threonine-phosphate decarboxylase CobD [Vagococcus intermedius]WEG72744.1 threonine-phosphate decarboxylase CobD [Vagococcus intermedius]WEG74830.1 threonine-phosphate decarboxylase CobD [Vagococcus intermedius]